MQTDDFFSEALADPVNALVYRVTRTLTAAHPDRALLASTDALFDVEEFAGAGNCQVEYRDAPLPLFLYDWSGADRDHRREPTQAWATVTWEGNRFDLVQVSYTTGLEACPTTARWVIAQAREAAERFFGGVCAWNAEVRGEVLVFAGGRWQKSAALYRAIRGATFDELVLPGDLKRELRDDLAQFFASRDVYERYGIPWKRGLLLVGPPGNGKTHAVKAIVNWLGKPCLYVKSLKVRYGSDHDSLRAVFERARETTPCLLVLEDLDSLIDDENRSFFLNELDGFAANTGIVLLATTNHPDRLDPAIVDRPSRFDRKYHFPLPAPAERAAYVAQWNAALEPDLRLSTAGQERAVSETDGFSFAYLKELFLSSMMRWIDAPRPGGMDEILAAQCRVLREQMNSASAAPSSETPSEPDADEDTLKLAAKMGLRRFGL